MTRTWDEHLLALAFETAKKSKDPNTQVGCVIVGEDHEPLSAGFNGLPIGVVDLPQRLSRTPVFDGGPRAKDLWVSHAEENAVALAARSGHRLKGSTAYVTHAPCSRCARMLLQAGVTAIVIADGTTTGGPEIEPFVAEKMFDEAGVELRRVVRREADQ